MTKHFAFMLIVSTLFQSKAQQGNQTILLEPPTFDIGRTVNNVEAIVSCGQGLLNNNVNQSAVVSNVSCVSDMKGDESNQSRSQLNPGCLRACDPESTTWLDVKKALLSDDMFEWRSQTKTPNSESQELNISITFPQMFEVQRISVQAGTTPLPAVWSIEKLPDHSSSYEAVQYFRAEVEDCSSYFGVPLSQKGLPRNETETEAVCVLRPNKSWEESVQVNFQASGIKLAFLKMWSNFNGNETVLDYYSIRKMSIQGRCVCNGHAVNCTLTGEGVMGCECQHNTCGHNCQTCCHGYTGHDNLTCAERADEKKAFTNGYVSEDPAISAAIENDTGLAVNDQLTVPVEQQINESSAEPLGNDTTAQKKGDGTAEENEEGRDSLIKDESKNRTTLRVVENSFPFDKSSAFGPSTNFTANSQRTENNTIEPFKEQFTESFGVQENSTQTLQVRGNSTISPTAENSSVPATNGNNRTMKERVENVTVWKLIGNGTETLLQDNATVQISQGENGTSVVSTERPTPQGPTDSGTVSPIAEPQVRERDQTSPLVMNSGTVLPENVTVPDELNATETAPAGHSLIWKPAENGTALPLNENSTVSREYTVANVTQVPAITGTKRSTVTESYDGSLFETNSSTTKDHILPTVSPSDDRNSAANDTLQLSKVSSVAPITTPTAQLATGNYSGSAVVSQVSAISAAPVNVDITQTVLPRTTTVTNRPEAVAMETTVESVTGQSTDMTGGQVSTTNAPTTETKNEHDNSTVSAAPTALQPSTDESKTNLTANEFFYDPTMSHSTMATPLKHNTELNSGENSTLFIPVGNSTYTPSAHNNTEDIVAENRTEPTAEEKATLSTPVEPSGNPTNPHDFSEGATEENSTMFTPVVSGNESNTTEIGVTQDRTTIQPIVMNITSKATKQTAINSGESTAQTRLRTEVPSASTPVGMNSKGSALPTLKTTEVSTTVPISTEPGTQRTMTNTAVLLNATMPTTLYEASVPVTSPNATDTINLLNTSPSSPLPAAIKLTSSESTTEPSTLSTTVESTTLETTSESITQPITTTLRTAGDVATSGSASIPRTEETTTLRTAGDVATSGSASIPRTEETTVRPTTEADLTEDEARILFGNLPKGVCYCNKFATLEKQCFPRALHKACVCLPNFNGTRCERCARGYFSYPFCVPCRCNALGATTSTCNQETGECYCKPGVKGRKCDACPLGSYSFPKCSPCDCNPSGSYGRVCDSYTGNCPCRYGVRGRRCDRCPAGYYSFPNCQWCGCNPLTTTEDICKDFFGSFKCLCRSNFKGLQCGECKKGFYDFPICKRCLCSPLGYGSCNQRGECVCNEGFAGGQCDRCAYGYYGFPNCRACNCNTFGSYSKLCNESTGQCQCKPNIRAKQCDRCAEGMVGFPTCVKCECNPDGTRFLPGITSGMCFGTAKYQCLCKSNVIGRTCDRCLHGFFNFSSSNPVGCTSCECLTRGTISETRHCHALIGRCDCKNHVIGMKCDKCRDGYHGVRSHDIFGCRECMCNPGGSVSRDCFKHIGDCRCRTSVTGKKCNRLLPSRPLYFPTLYHIYAEFEDAVLVSSGKRRVPIGADVDEFPSFSGTGYAILPAYKVFKVSVNIPKPRKYRVIFHYVLKDSFRVSARVELYAPGSKTVSHGFDVQFSPPSAKQTKNLLTTFSARGFKRDFFMKDGSCDVTVTSHSSILLLDYVVFLPEDYYKAKLLQDVPAGPCLLRTSKPEHCDMYSYYERKSPSVMTVSGDSGYTIPLRGYLDTFRDPRFNLVEVGLSNMALLGRNQPTIGFDITVPESGLYILMVKYLHPEKFVQQIFVTVGYERGMLEILPCKYQFACRQFVMDDNKRAREFEMKRKPDTNVVKLESSPSAKLAVISVTAIPQAKWTPQFVQPALLCKMFNKSCISSSYPTPEDAIHLAAFSQRRSDKVTSLFTGFVNLTGPYYIIVRYRQTNSISRKIERLSIRGHESLNTAVKFHYCPAHPGCRVVVGEENLVVYLESGLFTATIEHERRTHLDYVLLIPQMSYSSGLLELLSPDKVANFLHNCGKDHFYINPTRGRHCREDVFSLTIHFNGEPLPCKCNVLGSQSTFCEQFGGQCRCRPNVIGRRCDKCRLGYSGFPRCRRCGCHDIGSISPGCTSSGRCYCKKGFGGYKCDRCISSGYYGFPDCKSCGCDGLGSLSVFCRSRDGQCQCRRNFQGLRCNECRIGFYDFPECKECNCNPAGIKLTPGQKNGCGYVNNTQCTCKDNVEGTECDTCKDLHFNLQISNPVGCQSCDCDTNGTLGSIKSCDKTTGQCLCKSHVTGRTCDRCKEGFYNLNGPDVFGCRRCSCNAGGSISRLCNEVTGVCSCLPGIGGSQCNRVSSDEYYYPTLHQFRTELEDSVSDHDNPSYFRHSESEFPSFSWRGYVVFSQSQNLIHMMIDVPRTTTYQLIFYYMLARQAPVTALVKFIPTLDSALLPSGPAREQVLDVRFRSTASWIFPIAEFLVVRDNWGDTRQVLLSQGKWKLTIAAPASDLLVDYMVLIPKEYYRPQNLQEEVSKPCELSGNDKYCVYFTYPSLEKGGFVTIEAEDRSVYGGIRRNERLPDIPFQGLTLTGARNTMSVRLPSLLQGDFVLIATYFHNAVDAGLMDVVLTSGLQSYRAQITILSCRYRFGCRQVAVDQNHKVKVFKPGQNEVATISLATRFTVALDSITAIPLSEWDHQLIEPIEQCISNGYSCVPASYPIPPDAVRIETEDRNTGGDRGPSYMLDRGARLKYLRVGEKTLHVSGSARSGRYYVVVHFYQPNYLSFLGKVVVSGQNAASTLMKFHHCAHVSGCRAVGTSQYREGMIETVYVGRQNSVLVSIVIPEDKDVWLDYVLLVPLQSFSPSIVQTKPVDVTQDFIQDCGQYTFFLKASSSEFCLRSAFTITTRFNNGALPCRCDTLGSSKRSCQSFGGQCICRPNVIGKKCDRCRSGYSGFPYCREIAR